MSKKALLFFLFYTILIPGFSQINKYGQPFYTNYTIKNYKANSQNWAIARDNNGLLYFANNDGVLQYDGHNWKLIKINRDAIVRSLAIDTQGIIYIGAENEFGFIKPNAQGKLIYTSISDSLNKENSNFSNIERIHITNKGILFCGFRKIFKYVNKQIAIIKLPKGGFFTLQVNKTHYMGNYYHGLMQLKDTAFVTCKGGEFYEQKDIYHIIPYTQEELLIQTLRNGLYIYNTNTGKSSKPIGAKSNFLNKYLAEYFLRNAISYGQNYIINTCFGGSLMVDSSFDALEIIDQNLGLQDDRIAAAEIHKAQSATSPLWLAMMNGISKIEYPISLRYFDKKFGLEHEIYDLVRFQGNMYFSSINGVYVLEEKGNYPFFRKIKSTAGECWSITTHNDIILFGGEYNIYVLSDKNINTYETNAFVTKLYYSDNHQVLFVGEEDGLYLYRIQQKRLIGGSKISQINDRILKIFEDTASNIWLTTGNSELIKLEITSNDTIINLYKEDKGLPQSESLHAFELNGKMYLSNKSNIYQYKSELDTIVVATKMNTFLQKKLIGVDDFHIDKNHYWFISNEKGKGSNEVKNIQKNADQTYTDLSTPFKRLPECVINAIYPDEDGVLWIATSEGLFTYNPNTKVKYDDPFNTLIRKVYVGEDSIIYHGNRLINEKQTTPILEYQNNGLTFHYSATSYIEESENEYSYFLEGFNETANEWSNWSTETKKEYTNLREGKYTFKVKARNIYGTESSIATYKFEIKPPWYRTFFAYSGYFILLIILIYIIVKLNIRRLQADKERLEGIVKERTAKIRNQRDQIEKQHDEITASIKYAKRIQRALLPPDELIYSKLPDHFILFKPRDVVSGDFYWMKQEGDLTLITAADCTGHGVPGAFMSMLGMAFLNEIVKNGGVLTAGRILTQLRDKVKTSLRQTGKEGEAKDGMDIAFCVIDQKNRKLQFAGAYNPLILIRSVDKPAPKKMDCIKTVSNEIHTLYEVKADKMPIGIHISEKENFTNFQIDLLENDTLYMFSDGYADQIGGPKNRKFMSKHFKQLLLEIQPETMEQQKMSLNLAIENWKGDQEQVDDIVLIGIRV
jgi:serine phosphatase RsbU (regulator of sigma subunit)/ligand-binding sensor domain-containing protein